MFRLAADTLDFVNSFPAVIPDFDSGYSKKIDFSDLNNRTTQSTGRHDPPRIIVFIHCHYPDVLEYFSAYLSYISDYDLMVTITSPRLASAVSEWASRLKPNLKSPPRRLSIECFPNNGRDVRPFWKAGVEISSDYTVFLKLHTKSSPHYQGFAGLSWLKDILDNLLVNTSSVQQIARMIHAEEYGAVFPVPWRPFRHFGWTNRQNLYHAQKVCKALLIDPAILFTPLQYPSGNMYWGSTSLFSSYGERILSSFSWPEEPLATDGTLLHCFERMIGYLYMAQRKKIAFSACSGSTLRGQGIFSWQVEESSTEDGHSFRLAAHEGETFLSIGDFPPATSLALFSTAINTSMFPKRTMLPKPRFLVLIRNILSYPRHLKRILLDDFIHLSAGHFTPGSTIEASTSGTHPFMNVESSIWARLQRAGLIRKTNTLFRSMKGTFPGQNKQSRR